MAWKPADPTEDEGLPFEIYVEGNYEDYEVNDETGEYRRIR